MIHAIDHDLKFELDEYPAETFRTLRLQRVIGYVSALVGPSRVFDFFSMVKKISDYKGVLGIYWKSIPRDEDRSFFSRAWDSENEPSVLHYLVDGANEREI